MRLPNFIPQRLMPREERFFGLLRSSTRNLHSIEADNASTTETGRES